MYKRPGRKSAAILGEFNFLTGASIYLVERRERNSAATGADAEALRVQRLREDARRPLSVNLAEGIALSHKLLQFTGVALKG